MHHRHQQELSFQVVHYGQLIYINHVKLHRKIWSRGFIDKKIYLCNKSENQSIFTIEPKKGLYVNENKRKVPVVFGAEVLIRHTLSGQYLSIRERDDIPTLEFEKQETPSCYFEFKPTRSFQSNGNAITVKSLFQIEHAERKLFISCFHEEVDDDSSDEKNNKSMSMNDSRVSQAGEIFSKSEKRPEKDSSIGKMDFTKKLKKKDSIMADSLQMKKSMTFDDEPTSPLYRVKSTDTDQQFPKESAEEDPDTPHLPIAKHKLPIYRPLEGIIQCHLENQPDSHWKFQLYDSGRKTKYLENNQFIYFTHSQQNQVISVDLEKKTFEANLVKVSLDHQKDYLVSSIFLVEIGEENDGSVYLKHYLSGLYFAGLNKSLVRESEKKKSYLIPLLPPKKKQLPPFHIKIQDRVRKGNRQKQKQRERERERERERSVEREIRQKMQEDELQHGYWLNKVSKHEIAEIMSLQNVSREATIQYLIEYLRVNTKRRQNILREFQFISYLIKKMIPDVNAKKTLKPADHPQPSQITQSSQISQHSNNSQITGIPGITGITGQRQKILKSCYQLLFFIVKNNNMNKKKCLHFLDDILQEKNKELILDLLTELLSDNSSTFNPLEKYIVSEVIEKQLREFINHNDYSINFMRIFRVFCGSDQPCVRNQNLIFNLFFWNDDECWKNDDDTNLRMKGMTETVLHTQRSITIPQNCKFRFFEDKNELYFCNGGIPIKYDDLRAQICVYIRQYYYLLSDCLSNNYNLIKKFTKEVPMKFLLKLLEQPKMKGPALSMIYNSYLKPQRNYKPNIFHGNYDKICLKGSLMAVTIGEVEEKLLKFIRSELSENKEYSSTTFRILLNVFKMTIENGYWMNFEDLLDVSKMLEGINMQEESMNEYHSSYEEKVCERNLMKSKITSISISISLIQMQVSLWTSDFLSEIYSEKQIEEKIVNSIKNNKDWVIDKNLFRICSTNNPELMRKSLLLLYKIYNLQKISYKTYEQAEKQKKSSLELTTIFTTLQNNAEQMSIEVYFSLISSCVKDLTIEELLPISLNKSYRNVESIFKYKQVNEEVQIMFHKLGIHEKLLKDVKRYNGLRLKEKESEEQVIYWKLLLLYAMIRNNLKLRDILSEYRSIFITILETDKSKYIYYVAVDILEELYRNHRKLIISDNEELRQICNAIGKIIQSTGEITELKCCKMVNLLGIFIETGNRKIVENHQNILKTIFTKDVLKKLRGIMNQRKSFKEQENTENKEHFRDILQILVFDLMSSLEQKKLLLNFQRPNNTTINSILLGIGNRNWNLKSKVFSCINFKQQMPEKLPIQFMRLILYDLNIMCESIQNNHQSKQLSKQVKIYISNMIAILDTIDSIFSYITQRKKLNSEESEEVILIIKIVERLYVIKGMCPLVVRKKIKQLKIYMKVIQNIIDKANLQINILAALNVIELTDFEKNQIKEKLPLLYNEKIKQKVEKKREQRFYDESKDRVDRELGKKTKWNMNMNNTGALKMEESQMQELQAFLVCLSNVNKSDSTVLSDNIKQFLVNFLKTSFLPTSVLIESQTLNKMQDILVDYEIPSVICSIFEEPFKQRYKLFYSTFQLANRMLEGGNSRCQARFLQHFREDSKNWIFQNIHNLIYDTLKTIEFYYHYEDDPTIKSYEMMLELEEVYICKEQRMLSCKLLGEVFRFLQLLCENDNHLMKEYVFNQIDKEDHIKYMSKNFLEDAQVILDGVFFVLTHNVKELRNYPDPKFEQEIRDNIFCLPVYILDFLIEVCQIPAEQNQLYLCKTDFFDFVKNLMLLKEDVQNDSQEIFMMAVDEDENNKNSKKQSIFFQIERKMVILFRSLLEQNSQEIIDLMRKKLCKQEFQFFIEESCIHGGLQDIDKLKQMYDSSLQLNSYVENIVDILIVKKILKNDEKFTFASEKLAIIEQLNNRIQSINVFFENHSLTVYFPSHPLFSLLTKKTKDYLLDRSANLNTRKEKLTQFLISRKMIYEDINQEKEAEKRLMNDKKMGYLFNFALLLCFLIITLLVLFYSVSKSGVVLDIFEHGIIRGLSYMQLIVSAIYTILLGFNGLPIISEKIKTNQQRREKSRQKQKDLSLNQQQQAPNKIVTSSWRLLKALYFDQADSAHALLLLVISFYSCFFEVRAYSFALLFVFAKFELLQSIFKAIRLTWKQLAFVSLLALAFSFIFGFITLNYYIGPLYDNEEIDIDIDHINEHCNSIVTCISSLYTQKIIGESVSDDEEYNYGRFVADLIFWGFFQILLSNMIAAIIIDKFAEQRNVKQKIYNDRYSKCYICFADRSILERRGEDFDSHVTNMHSLWNYFYYMYTLENLKHITEFTGIEYWINRQVKNNLIDWLPIDDSLKEETGEESLEDLLRKLKPLLLEREFAASGEGDFEKMQQEKSHQ